MNRAQPSNALGMTLCFVVLLILVMKVILLYLFSIELILYPLFHHQLPLCQFIKLKIEGTKIRGFITQNKEQTIDESELLCNLFNTKSSTLNSVKTFPNPTNNYLYFKGLENEIDISITDLLGRNAYNTKVNPIKNVISLADLASGIYIVRMQYLSSVLLVKIVKF
jgi:hypothetical protein